MWTVLLSLASHLSCTHTPQTGSACYPGAKHADVFDYRNWTVSDRGGGGEDRDSDTSLPHSATLVSWLARDSGEVMDVSSKLVHAGQSLTHELSGERNLWGHQTSGKLPPGPP